MRAAAIRGHRGCHGRGYCSRDATAHGLPATSTPVGTTGPCSRSRTAAARAIPTSSGLENTLVAFDHAVALGYPYLETDVHTTSDGVLLAFHDDVLDRVTSQHRRPSPRRRTSTCAERPDRRREPIPRDGRPARALPGHPLQHRPQVGRGRRRSSRTSSSAPAPTTGCASGRSPSAGCARSVGWCPRPVATSYGPIGRRAQPVRARGAGARRCSAGAATRCRCRTGCAA